MLSRATCKANCWCSARVHDLLRERQVGIGMFKKPQAEFQLEDPPQRAIHQRFGYFPFLNVFDERTHLGRLIGDIHV